MLMCYPVELVHDENGAVFARFPDVPHARTVAPDEATAMERAPDALRVALASLMDRDKDVPQPSSPAIGQATVPVSTMIAAKIAIYQAMREGGLSNRGLGSILNIDEKQVRRLLDLDHNSRWDQIELALQALGRTLVVEVRRVKPVVASDASNGTRKRHGAGSCLSERANAAKVTRKPLV